MLLWNLISPGVFSGADLFDYLTVGLVVGICRLYIVFMWTTSVAFGLQEKVEAFL